MWCLISCRFWSIGSLLLLAFPQTPQQEMVKSEQWKRQMLEEGCELWWPCFGSQRTVSTVVKNLVLGQTRWITGAMIKLWWGNIMGQHKSLIKEPMWWEGKWKPTLYYPKALVLETLDHKSTYNILFCQEKKKEKGSVLQNTEKGVCVTEKS